MTTAMDTDTIRETTMASTGPALTFNAAIILEIIRTAGSDCSFVLPLLDYTSQQLRAQYRAHKASTRLGRPHKCLTTTTEQARESWCSLCQEQYDPDADGRKKRETLKAAKREIADIESVIQAAREAYGSVTARRTRMEEHVAQMDQQLKGFQKDRRQLAVVKAERKKLASRLQRAERKAARWRTESRRLRHVRVQHEEDFERMHGYGADSWTRLHVADAVGREQKIHIATLEAEVERLQGVQGQVTGMQTERDRLRDEIDTNRQEGQMREVYFAELQGDLQAANTNLAEHKVRMEVCTAKQIEMQAAVQSEQSRAANAIERFEGSETENSRLRAELGVRWERLAGAEAKAEAVDVSFSKAQGSVEQLVEEKVTLEQELETVKTARADAEMACTATEATLTEARKSAKSEAADLRKQRNEEQQGRAHAEEERDRLAKTLEASETALQEARGCLETSEQQRTSLGKRLVEAKTELQDAEDTQADLSERSDDESEGHVAPKAEIALMEEKYNDIEAELELPSAESMQTISHLTSSLDRCSKEAARFGAALEDFKEKNKQLNDRLAESQQQITVCEEKLAQSEREKKQLSDRLAKSQQMTADVEKQLTHVKLELKALMDDLAASQQTTADSEDQIIRLERQLDVRAQGLSERNEQCVQEQTLKLQHAHNLDLLQEDYDRLDEKYQSSVSELKTTRLDLRTTQTVGKELEATKKDFLDGERKAKIAIQRLSDNKELLTERLTAAERSNTEVKAEQQGLMDKMEMLENRYEAAMQAKTQVEKAKTKVNAALTGSQSEVASLSRQLNILRTWPNAETSAPQRPGANLVAQLEDVCKCAMVDAKPNTRPTAEEVHEDNKRLCARVDALEEKLRLCSLREATVQPSLQQGPWRREPISPAPTDVAAHDAADRTRDSLAPPSTTPVFSSVLSQRCMQCQDRRCKCDKVFPCGACEKRGVECQPAIPAAAAPKKRKRVSQGGQAPKRVSRATRARKQVSQAGQTRERRDSNGSFCPSHMNDEGSNVAADREARLEMSTRDRLLNATEPVEYEHEEEHDDVDEDGGESDCRQLPADLTTKRPMGATTMLQSGDEESDDASEIVVKPRQRSSIDATTDPSLLEGRLASIESPLNAEALSSGADAQTPGSPLITDGRLPDEEATARHTTPVDSAMGTPVKSAAASPDQGHPPEVYAATESTLGDGSSSRSFQPPMSASRPGSVNSPALSLRSEREVSAVSRGPNRIPAQCVSPSEVPHNSVDRQVERLELYQSRFAARPDTIKGAVFHEHLFRPLLPGS